MARCGINVIPTVEDAQFCRKPMKLAQLERALHSQVATYDAHFINIIASPITLFHDIGLITKWTYFE
jgi:hypothetical protein